MPELSAKLKCKSSRWNSAVVAVLCFSLHLLAAPTLAEPAAIPDFTNDVLPLLSRYGCNSGGCHGKASGQNGFKLSLFGYDPQFDYEAIVSQARGRRIFQAAPERSLLLAKAIAATPHGGGKRFEPESEAYRILRTWIEAGSPPANATAAKLVRLHIAPSERIMKPGEEHRLVVEGEYGDGRRRDVTAQSQFSSNLEPVAGVDEAGVIRLGTQRGEATVMARYMGEVTVFRVIVPHGEPLAAIPNFTPANYIDELAAEKWKKLGLLPSPPADDATFLRRVTLDLCGRLPTVEESRTFMADPSADKRRQVIDRLLDSADYPAFFAMRWGTILRNSNLAGADQATYAFHNWMKDMIARNRPYDEFVRGIVAASGEWQDAPAINWFWQSRDDQLHQVTADTSQVFLGIRLQCARCHHHPYERWSQDDYFGLAGFYTRLGRKSFGQPPPYFSSANITVGEVHPVTKKGIDPKYLNGPVAKFSAEEDPRHGLVDWMAQPENPFFARVLVNRLWGHFLGRGIVHEVDDMRETNPPSNPQLLEALSKDFRDHKFDVKHMIRTIVNSRVYQLSSEPTPENEHDRQNFARFYARRIISEVFSDAVDQATGSRTQYSGMTRSGRAVDLPHENFGSYFLDTFDRPRRVSGCECERSSGATLAQVLLLSNSDDIENKIAAGDGRVAKQLKDNRPVSEIIEDMFLAALARKPSPKELTTTVAYVTPVEADAGKKQQALEDIVWSIINSKEFMFNH